MLVNEAYSLYRVSDVGMRQNDSNGKYLTTQSVQIYRCLEFKYKSALLEL